MKFINLTGVPVQLPFGGALLPVALHCVQCKQLHGCETQPCAEPHNLTTGVPIRAWVKYLLTLPDADGLMEVTRGEIFGLPDHQPDTVFVVTRDVGMVARRRDVVYSMSEKPTNYVTWEVGGLIRGS